MDSEAQFDQLARATRSSMPSRRGRRRSLVIMMLAFIPSPFLVMALNNDDGLAGLIPIGIAFVGRHLVLLVEVAASSRRLPVGRLRRTRPQAAMGDVPVHAARQPDR